MIDIQEIQQHLHNINFHTNDINFICALIQFLEEKHLLIKDVTHIDIDNDGIYTIEVNAYIE